MLINVANSCLLVIDIQERLAPTMAECDSVISNTGILLKAAERLQVPVLTSEQYPRGLGHTVPELEGLVANNRVLEKTHFSCLGDSGFGDAFDSVGRTQAIVAGIEAHVCVLQTVSDLVERGNHVFVVADATSSRKPDNHRAALARMNAMGAQIVSTEMVVFEWLGRAGTPEFKDVSLLIR
jgi:nicotinamidase-related amidase